VTVQSDLTSSIWIAPGVDTSRAKQITSGVGKYGAGVLDDDSSGFTKMDVGEVSAGRPTAGSLITLLPPASSTFGS
jgi:hypothetical protein